MSYDIYLKDPVTKETAIVPAHLMIGGTYRADYHPETDTFTPALNTDAHLNITYNYGVYYYEVYEEGGIRKIYGMMGVDSIPLLENMIATLTDKYFRDGDWITTKKIIVDRYEGVSKDYWEATAANSIKPLYQLLSLAKMRPDCFWDGD